MRRGPVGRQDSHSGADQGGAPQRPQGTEDNPEPPKREPSGGNRLRPVTPSAQAGRATVPGAPDRPGPPPANGTSSTSEPQTGTSLASAEPPKPAEPPK